MNSESVSVYGVGDVRPEWPNPESLFTLARPTLNEPDILFGQLECVLPKHGQNQAQASAPGGRGGPEIAALKSAGFDVMSCAGNHAMDSGEDGLLETIDILTRNNIAAVGAGSNIVEARRPQILERKGVRVAFLAYCSVLPEGYDARPDKPGCAPMRASTSFEQIDWQPGCPPQIITIANKDDLAALVNDIAKVRAHADVVILSIHWGVHFVPAMIAMYETEVAHAAIDAGVDLILGHHAHLLKAVEVYKGKVIFYGLGNFVHPITIEQKAKGDAKGKRNVRYIYKVKDDPEYPCYPFPADARNTMIAKCVISGKKIDRVSYLPAFINKHVQPEVLGRQDKRFDMVSRYVDEITKDQRIETRFSVEGNEVVVCT